MPTETSCPTPASDTATASWTKTDTQWVLTLFGTAVGAGILFLPINAGLGGIWPLVMMTLLVGPMTYFAHRGLARFCISASPSNTGITDAVTEHFGHSAGRLLTVGYFLAIFPILMIYGIGITNTVTSLMTTQLGMEEPPHRALLSFLLTGGLISIMVCGQHVVLRVCSLIVYPLIAVLLGTSLYLIPQWNLSQFHKMPSASDCIHTLFLTIPLFVFAFNHSPAISSFSTAYRKEHGHSAESHASLVLKRTSFLLVGFTMLFVFSCVLTLTPDELAAAKSANLPILSVFAQRTANPLFGWLAQIVALVAIASSFFGHYMGTHEGLRGLIIKHIQNKHPNSRIHTQQLNGKIRVFILLSVWAAAYFNISVMDMIEAVVAPIIAGILFLMPVYAVRTVPAMKRFASATNIFTLIMGVIAILGFIASQLI